jgi:hypothetical protein
MESWSTQIGLNSCATAESETGALSYAYRAEQDVPGLILFTCSGSLGRIVN